MNRRQAEFIHDAAQALLFQHDLLVCTWMPGNDPELIFPVKLWSVKMMVADWDAAEWLVEFETSRGTFRMLDGVDIDANVRSFYARNPIASEMPTLRIMRMAPLVADSAADADSIWYEWDRKIYQQWGAM